MLLEIGLIMAAVLAGGIAFITGFGIGSILTPLMSLGHEGRWCGCLHSPFSGDWAALLAVAEASGPWRAAPLHPAPA